MCIRDRPWAMPQPTPGVRLDPSGYGPAPLLWTPEPTPVAATRTQPSPGVRAELNPTALEWTRELDPSTSAQTRPTLGITTGVTPGVRLDPTTGSGPTAL
eukprot:1863490-Pyramimonas_sp.AAC.1